MTDLPPPIPMGRRKAIMIMIAVGILCCVIGLVSSIYMGNDNPIEQTVEQLLDVEVEKILNLPDDSVNIDLSPDK